MKNARGTTQTNTNENDKEDEDLSALELELAVAQGRPVSCALLGKERVRYQGVRKLIDTRPTQPQHAAPTRQEAITPARDGTT